MTEFQNIGVLYVHTIQAVSQVLPECVPHSQVWQTERVVSQSIAVTHISLCYVMDRIGRAGNIFFKPMRETPQFWKSVPANTPILSAFTPLFHHSYSRLIYPTPKRTQLEFQH